jgi:hypothetical protein
VNGIATPSHSETVDLRAHADHRNGTQKSEDLTIRSVEGSTVNDRSTDVSQIDPTPPNDQSPHVEETKDAECEVETAVVESTTCRAGPKILRQKSSRGELPAPSERSTSPSGKSLPFRLIVSVDHLAAGNPLVRPVRKRFLGLASSFSKAIEEMAATSQDEAEG